MKKKFLVKCICLFFILIIVSATICNAAAVAVTDEILNTAFQKFVTSEANENNYDISLENNIINIKIDEENYSLNYDLTEKPTFSLEVPIQEGMSYDDFMTKTDNLVLPMLGYIAVANIQGVEIEDSSMYFLYSYLSDALSGSFSTEDSYMIIDDLNLSEGVTIEKTDDPKTIYASEFGERVMEYVNNVYAEKQTITDSTGINSYSLTIEKLDTTTISCKLVSTLSVNLDADFSQLVDFANQQAESFLNADITKENADYIITLKVGQKCKLETTQEINGYEFYGYDCVEINDEYTEITATDVGTKNGYLYVGEEKKSIYITVEENDENETLDTITLKLDKTIEFDPPTEEKQEEVNKIANEETKDNTVATSSIPQTGLNNSIFFVILALIISVLIAVVKINKYKEIE